MMKCCAEMMEIVLELREFYDLQIKDHGLLIRSHLTGKDPVEE